MKFDIRTVESVWVIMERSSRWAEASAEESFSLPVSREREGAVWILW